MPVFPVVGTSHLHFPSPPYTPDSQQPANRRHLATKEELTIFFASPRYRRRVDARVIACRKSAFFCSGSLSPPPPTFPTSRDAARSWINNIDQTNFRAILGIPPSSSLFLLLCEMNDGRELLSLAFPSFLFFPPPPHRPPDHRQHARTTSHFVLCAPFFPFFLLRG